MSQRETHSINLNIGPNSPKEVWDKIPALYEKMPGWIGFHREFPFWYGDLSDEKYISASLEPGGLQFSSRMDEEEWELWLEKLKRTATEMLGFPVGEPEDGYL